MDLRITSNIKQFERGLNDAARRQIPFALSLAINEVLSDVRKNWVKRLRKSLDRPTPFTLRGFAIKRASKRRLTGMVFAKPIQNDYLARLEDGGTRIPRRRAIPVPVGQRRNRYGNMPRGAVSRVLAKPNTFSGTPKGGGTPGIYQRLGTRRKSGGARLKLLVHYADLARYTPRLALRAGAMKTATARLPGAMLRAMRRALGR